MDIANQVYALVKRREDNEISPEEFDGEIERIIREQPRLSESIGRFIQHALAAIKSRSSHG